MNFAALINFLGFASGIALYAVLLLMVVRHPISLAAKGIKDIKSKRNFDRVLLGAAILGLLWNLGNTLDIVWSDYWNGGQSSSFLRATAFSSLGFLPAVVVHSEWLRAAEKHGTDSKSKWLAIASYVSSCAAAVLHFYNAAVFDSAPSVFGLRFVIAAYLTILIGLFLTTGQSIAGKSIWMAALAVFVVSALHLSHPNREGESVIVELIGHQASLPLALLILYQDYRFAFADLFLKRALSFLFLIIFASAMYLLVVVPLSAFHQTHPQPDAQSIVLIIAFGAACAFAYPQLNRFAVWFVDRVILRRVAYERLQIEIMERIFTLEPIEAVLNEIKERLASALTAKTAYFRETYQESDSASIIATETRAKKKVTEINKAKALKNSLVRPMSSGAEITIPTADEPRFELILLDLAGGRRLLSDEIAMLEQVALHTARRVDELRVTHERCERELREQELSKLAAEAELRVLRAQINPHFLFNALTTIGYLINTAPERAVQTLVQLTGLLRGSLRSTSEFQTLGDELKLIRAYLEIEQARFEERLKIEIDVPENFLSFRIPSLTLQPLVENAVKHGISPQKKGGTIRIEAGTGRDGQQNCEKDFFILRVVDTGAGVSKDELRIKRETRVGLNNVEQRLHLHYDGTAHLSIEERIGGGTIVEIRFDGKARKPQNSDQVTAAVIGGTVGRAF